MKSWFSKLIKPKFFELGYNEKDHCIKKKNPNTSETICSICDFSICPFADKEWFDHVRNCEHLFLRNFILTKSMGIDNIEEYK